MLLSIISVVHLATCVQGDNLWINNPSRSWITISTGQNIPGGKVHSSSDAVVNLDFIPHHENLKIVAERYNPNSDKYDKKIIDEQFTTSYNLGDSAVCNYAFIVTERDGFDFRPSSFNSIGCSSAFATLYGDGETATVVFEANLFADPTYPTFGVAEGTLWNFEEDKLTDDLNGLLRPGQIRIYSDFDLFSTIPSSPTKSHSAGAEGLRVGFYRPYLLDSAVCGNANEYFQFKSTWVAVYDGYSKECEISGNEKYPRTWYSEVAIGGSLNYAQSSLSAYVISETNPVTGALAVFGLLSIGYLMAFRICSKSMTFQAIPERAEV